MEKLIHIYLTSFPTIALICIIAAMLYTLSKGADILVDEAVSLSVHWGVPKMIIGATIVSLGTTLPEATVSVLAAIHGNPDLALGNAIGSIIADTGLIIGLAALIGHLPVDQTIINRQGKVQFFSGILLATVSLPVFSNGISGNISQWMGWVFLLILAIYTYISLKWVKGSESDKAILAEEKSPLIVQIIKLILGIILVIGSSKILIPAVGITAIRVGIPQSVIAATLVAFGTSLPELITAITAVKKGHGELAVGNIIGADILNVFFVVGSAAAVTKGGLDVPFNFYKLQIPTMLIILFAFRIFTKNRNNEISKKEGLFLAGIYFAYLALNYIWI
ncbi:sodium:calcium antiporter [Paramaledivibacter caminithermalis]|jgi:cation:H+ antiporter|uniref:Cation:H+ antiporter n=1 Tax=Paramaledivibacter caminithermalis (strain DSM 15212 / CIP 107654 / DViRD3) TaxID=1121301 RepID=A0A1M6LH94_PARC5|nr:sodium:calcium antiporter [Paramaledivibacter caminithermalis]SHJ70572.1 cation:H+ antiporter [Paramaledivibacter caminithermalis DSM 15212]